MKPREMLTITYCLFVMITSCKKNTGEPVQAVDTVMINYSNDPVAALNKEVATILEQVYQSDKAYEEVNAAIYSGYYEDERVLLKDLLFPEESILYTKEEFKKYLVDTGVFRKAFCEIIERGGYPLTSEQFNATRTKRQTRSSLTFENAAVIGPIASLQAVSIYFPYSENFANATVVFSKSLSTIKKPAIVAADREADTATGRQPYPCIRPTDICYKQVTVDDGFAEVNPTHIVGVGAEPKQAAVQSATVSTPVSRAYHGWSKLIVQMDRLISLTGNGGGSEIKVARINGYLKQEDQQVTKFEGDVVTVQYTRADIRKKRWKRVFSIWDPNWNYQDIEQVYAVYEDDTQGKKTFTGSLTTTVNLPGKPSLGKAVGEIGYKIEVMTQDEIITQRKQDRKSFFADALNNQGWGFISDSNDFLDGNKDWPVLDGGTVWQYSMAYRMY